MAGRFSGSEPNVISHTGSTLRRSFPMTPTYSSRPSMYSSTSASEWVCSWMKAMRSTNCSSSSTTEACAMPSEASSVDDFTNIGKVQPASVCAASYRAGKP